jgi:hypothetical protein
VTDDDSVIRRVGQRAIEVDGSRPELLTKHPPRAATMTQRYARISDERVRREVERAVFG